MTRSPSPPEERTVEKDSSYRPSPSPSTLLTTPQLLPESQDLSTPNIAEAFASLPPDLVQHARSMGLPIDGYPELLPRAAKYLSTFTAALSARGPAPRRPGRPARPATIAYPLLALQVTAQDLGLNFPITSAVRRSTLPVRSYQTSLDLFRTTLNLRTPEGPSIQTLSIRYGCPMGMDAQVKALKDAFLPRWQAAQAASREKQSRPGCQDAMDSPSLACFICICRAQKVKLPMMEVLRMATESLPVMRRWIKLVEDQCPQELSTLASQAKAGEYPSKDGSVPRKRGRPPKVRTEGMDSDPFRKTTGPISSTGEEPPRKRGPGRPRKIIAAENNDAPPVKRGPGRPRKIKVADTNGADALAKEAPGKAMGTEVEKKNGENIEDKVQETERIVRFDPDSPFVSKDDMGFTEAEIPKKRGRGRPKKSEGVNSVPGTPKTQRVSFMEKLRLVVAAQDDTGSAPDLSMSIALAPPMDGLNPMVPFPSWRKTARYRRYRKWLEDVSGNF
ncbi:hypothetical protein BJ684DRAFT_15466 [Piptocephalis cylindrospora]|uniref:Uncharacterized protein n=1 Tax=Piptocephalis cylindrospora TaxID=1907219 RepID=A0A4P9Y628_9FUNG|nr:hypothetical protein BJ684DRAFT_15466 [Piptocephalis cylindrospora]|eukprot:RKP14194.1 hypothetical protein BJ684DRAFT_15466 [Piptocephalis cylindrospora]